MPRPRLSAEEKEESEQKRREYRRLWTQKKREEERKMQKQAAGAHQTPFRGGYASASSAASAGYTTESSIGSDDPPPPVETPQFFALSYPASPRASTSYKDVPPTPDMQLFRARWQAKQEMRKAQADRILQAQAQADKSVKESLKYNLDKTSEDLSKLAASEERDLDEAFPALVEGRELFQLGTINEEEVADSKPSATKKRKADATPVKTSAKKSKVGSAAKARSMTKAKVSSAAKVKVRSRDLDFAFKKPGVYMTKESVLLMDERLPGEKWSFDHVMPTIAEID